MLTVLLGGLALVVAPAFTERTVGSVGDDPAGCFVYGVATLVLLVLLTIALVMTVLGVLLAIAMVLHAVGLWGSGPRWPTPPSGTTSSVTRTGGYGRSS